MNQAILYVLANGFRRTIKDSIMWQCMKPELTRYRQFDAFLSKELSAGFMERMVEKFHQAPAVTK